MKQIFAVPAIKNSIKERGIAKRNTLFSSPLFMDTAPTENLLFDPSGADNMYAITTWHTESIVL
jgi:hypothetical protein